MGRRTQRRRVHSLGAQPTARIETLAVEEPLEVRIAVLPDGGLAAGGAPAALRPPSQSIVTTTRLPGDDFDLALGHLLAYGYISEAADVAAMMHCTDTTADGSPTFNVVEVTLAAGVTPAIPGANTSSGCGLQAATLVEGLRARLPHPLGTQAAPFSVAVLEAGLTQLAARAKAAASTGIPAAALIESTGTMRVIREDLNGAHALAKVLGWAAREGALPLRDHALVTTSRIGFAEITAALMAGVPVLASAAGTTTLAADAAHECGLTLISSLGEGRARTHSRADRLLQ